MKNNGERAIHGFVEVVVQAHTSVFARLNSSNGLFQEETSFRTNVIDACICISLPVTRGDPRLALLLPNGKRSMHTPYISIQTRVYLFPL